MKLNSTLYILICLLAFNTNSLASNSEKENLTITCSVPNCQSQDSLYLWEFNGVSFKKIKGTVIKDDIAVFELPVSSPKFIYIGLAANNIRPMIIGTEKNVVLNSDCKEFRKAQISDSEANKEYEQLKLKMNSIKQRFKSLMTQYQRSGRDKEKMKEINAKLKSLDTEKLGLLETTKRNNPYLAGVVSLNT